MNAEYDDKIKNLEKQLIIIFVLSLSFYFIFDCTLTSCFYFNVLVILFFQIIEIIFLSI